MQSIDIPAHLTPQCFLRAMADGREWPGVKPGDAVWTPQQRLNDMNSLGGDVPVVSTGAAFYFYELDPQRIARMRRECNGEKDAILWKNLERLLALPQPNPRRHQAAYRIRRRHPLLDVFRSSYDKLRTNGIHPTANTPRTR